MGAIEPGIRLAALQHHEGKIPPADKRLLWAEMPWWLQARHDAPPMTENPPREFYIQGLTLEGKTFRPSGRRRGIDAVPVVEQGALLIIRFFGMLG